MEKRKKELEEFLSKQNQDMVLKIKDEIKLGGKDDINNCFARVKEKYAQNPEYVAIVDAMLEYNTLAVKEEDGKRIEKLNSLGQSDTPNLTQKNKEYNDNMLSWLNSDPTIYTKKYSMGTDGKTPRWDCSLFTAKLVSNMISNEDPQGKAYLTKVISGKVSEEQFLILSALSNETPDKLSGRGIHKELSNYPSGTVLFIDSGDKGFDRHRAIGIDHVATIIEKNGEKIVIENTGRPHNKVIETPLDEYEKKNAIRYDHIYVVDANKAATNAQNGMKLDHKSMKESLTAQGVANFNDNASKYDEVIRKAFLESRGKDNPMESFLKSFGDLNHEKTASLTREYNELEAIYKKTMINTVPTYKDLSSIEKAVTENGIEDSGIKEFMQTLIEMIDNLLNMGKKDNEVSFEGGAVSRAVGEISLKEKEREKQIIISENENNKDKKELGF